MENELECPCTRNCPLYGNCVACYRHEKSVKMLPYCMDPTVVTSKELADRATARLLAAGVSLDDGIKKE